MDSNLEAQRDRIPSRMKRPLDHRIMAHISPLPPPEEVFLHWLMAVPAHFDLQIAAATEIERIDRCRLRHPDLDKLRTLLLAFVGKPVRAIVYGGC